MNSEFTCELCGADGRVTVLEGYRSGKPVMHSFCMSCADKASARAMEDSAETRIRIRAAVMLVGVCIAILGLFADRVHIGQADGFGFKQQTAALAGIIAIVVGAVFRIDFVAIVGTFLLGLAVIADVFGMFMGINAGGMRVGAMLFGIALITFGVARKRDARAD